MVEKLWKADAIWFGFLIAYFGGNLWCPCTSDLTPRPICFGFNDLISSSFPDCWYTLCVKLKSAGDFFCLLVQKIEFFVVYLSVFAVMVLKRLQN